MSALCCRNLVSGVKLHDSSNSPIPVGSMCSYVNLGGCRVEELRNGLAIAPQAHLDMVVLSRATAWKMHRRT